MITNNLKNSFINKPFDKNSTSSSKPTNALTGYVGRSIQDNKISVIQGSRSKGFDKIKALKESINEIRHSYSEKVGKSTFEQILGLSDAKDIPESMKNLALNKQGSWSNQAITLGVKKELAALFIAEKGSEAFYPKPLKGETVCNLDIGKFRTWFFEKFKSLTNDKNQGSKYNDDLIKDVWQHVSHETDCFGKFNGLNDITYNRRTEDVSFGKEYNYQEKIYNLVRSDNYDTRLGLAATKATFEDKEIFELKSTPRLSIITNEEIKNPENIVYVRPKGSDVFKEIKSKEMLPPGLKYIAYCSAESATDVSLLKTLARASLLPQDNHTQNSVTAYFLDEGSDPATLSIKCVTEFSPNEDCKDQFKISIFAHKTVDLTTGKILNYAVNVASNDEAREAPYNFWADKLKEEWQKRLDQHQDDPKIISGEDSILEVYNPKTNKVYSISSKLEDENKLGITIDEFESTDAATNLFVADKRLNKGALDKEDVDYFRKYLERKFTTLTASGSYLKLAPHKENSSIRFEIQGVDNEYLENFPYMYRVVFGELPAIDNALDISNNSRKSVGSVQSSSRSEVKLDTEIFKDLTWISGNANIGTLKNERVEISISATTNGNVKEGGNIYLTFESKTPIPLKLLSNTLVVNSGDINKEVYEDILSADPFGNTGEVKYRYIISASGIKNPEDMGLGAIIKHAHTQFTNNQRYINEAN